MMPKKTSRASQTHFSMLRLHVPREQLSLQQPASMTCSFPAREHFCLEMSYFALLIKNSKKQLCVITSRAERVLRSNTVTSSPAKRAVFTSNSILHLCTSAVSEAKTVDRIAVCWASRHHFSCDNP